ncbi:MAG: AMP-binding protein, partial [Desulfobacterales bacterium]
MNLARYLEISSERFPDKVAVRHEGQAITYKDLNAKCDSLAAGLKTMGLAEKDRCVLMMPNSIQAIIAYFALAKLGAVTVPVNFLYRTQELVHIFSDSKPKAFIGADPYLEEVREVLKISKGIPIRLAAGAKVHEDFTEFDAAYLPNPNFSSYPAEADDTLNILYTSGTTGRSKGVMLTHGNLASEAAILANMRGKLDSEAVVIGVLPLYHVYGITSVLNVSFYLGLKIELFRQFDPRKVIGVVEKEQQTILFAVPTMYNRLIQVAAESPPSRSSLKFCVSGGASLPVEFMHRFESLFSTKIYEG